MATWSGDGVPPKDGMLYRQITRASRIVSDPPTHGLKSAAVRITSLSCWDELAVSVTKLPSLDPSIGRGGCPLSVAHSTEAVTPPTCVFLHRASLGSLGVLTTWGWLEERTFQKCMEESVFMSRHSRGSYTGPFRLLAAADHRASAS